MSNVQWTKDQQKVIDLRNRNILVSAAAGSGKTAVLVERIITMITDEEHPVDIDRLLIVTFTNAAAAEMRDRIGKAIEKKIQKNPDNAHLQKQMSLIHSAQITTIHSFCLNVIRNHFNVIDLDPSFRIAEEAELKLLQSDVIGELLEQQYEEGSEKFTALVESYASGKSDTMLESLILQLYHFSISYPWPMEWLEEKKETFAIGTLEQLEQAPWMMWLMGYLKSVFADVSRQYDYALDLCYQEDGPYMYQSALEKEDDFVTRLCSVDSYEAMAEVMHQLEWARLPGKRDKNVSDEKKTTVKSIRDQLKKTLSDIKKNYFFQPVDEMLLDIQGVQPVMETLIDLTKEFSEKYAAEKESRGIVDFNDLEHFALHILVQKVDDSIKPTAVAVELSEQYSEILIDEYQDSNFVQETILNSISKEKFGQPNLFMVGDVKQSIYKFRMARPELFMEKYNHYSLTDSMYQRIDLQKNFRSRDVVLSTINFIFYQIMVKELGNIQYDEKAALYPGAKFLEGEEFYSKDSELILVGEALEEEVEEENNQEITDYTNKELEAKAVAKRIRELTDPVNGLFVQDRQGDTPYYRPAKLGDIVILFRTMSGWSDVFVDVLMSEGITAHAQTQSGYFSTLEIRTILNLLRIVDNPRQEIPLAAVLHSPIFSFTNEELAMVKVNRRERDLYDSLQDYQMDGEEQSLREKIDGFFHKLKNYREKVVYMSIYELITYMIEDTDYYQYVRAMPAGERRSGNIDMLIQQAIDFEQTSYAGVFDFIRYIEKLEKYDIDFGEANVGSENDNAVRIMSIHKSKGLEFPIVIVAGMGKTFNNQDGKGTLVLHPDMGLGPDYIDDRYRTKSPTLMKKVMQKLVVLENLAEELRVLYVALTRAKEKLIMIGYVKSLKKRLAEWGEANTERKATLSYSRLTSATSYMDWIIPSCRTHHSFVEMLDEFMEEVKCVSDSSQNEIPLAVRCMDVMELVQEEMVETVRKELQKDELLHWDHEKVYDEDTKYQLQQLLEYEYPYQFDANIHSKVTVTELKRMAQFTEEDEMVPLVEEPKEITIEMDPLIPKFISNESEHSMKATDRGTLYHRILQHMDFYESQTEGDVLLQLELLVARGLVKQEELDVIEVPKIVTFTSSDLARRMSVAKEEGVLYREQPFVMGQPANQVNERFQSDEMVLVQGIIDVFWEEDESIILMDYKTDYAKSPKQLVEKYKIQLDYYKKALETMTHKKVKEVYIYSFFFGKEIIVN